MKIGRRTLLLTPLALGACAALPGGGGAGSNTPILFVHGNGDSAALWHTTIWRFESNGWPRNRLTALDFPHPLARSDDTQAQDNRSSTKEQTDFLAHLVEEILTATGAPKLILIGSSRGGYPIRDYIKNREGYRKVSHAILCGTPNHGVRVGPDGINNEFNGAGPYLTGLNAGATEVHAEVAFMTIRSDNADKFAQPDGRYINRPGQPTGVGFDGPELKGATNVVLPGLDHREVAFGPKAFREMYKFITGAEPATLEVRPEPQIVLNGLISNHFNGAPTNLAMIGAGVEVYKVDPQTGVRQGEAVHRKTVGQDGRWGPFTGEPTATYEFVVSAVSLPITHWYRSPFPRGSNYVNFRPTPLEASDREAGDVVVIVRPRGYFGVGRDTFTIDGKVPPGVTDGVPNVSLAKLNLPGPPRSAACVFNSERIVVRTWPTDQVHLTIAEFHD